MLKKISQDDSAAADAEAREKTVQAIEKVFENLGLDAKERWDVVRQIAANLGHPIGGRPKGTKKWDFDRLFVLGADLYQIELKYPNASDQDLAQQIQQKWPDDYKYENPDSLRKRLPMARRRFKDLMEQPGIEQAWSEFCHFLFPPEILNHADMQEFLERHWPTSAEIVKIIIKASAPVRRAQERQRRKVRRD